MKRTKRLPRKVSLDISQLITRNVCLISTNTPRITKEVGPSRWNTAQKIVENLSDRNNNFWISLYDDDDGKAKKTKQEKINSQIFCTNFYTIFAQTQQSGAQFANHVNVNCQSMNQKLCMSMARVYSRALLCRLGKDWTWFFREGFGGVSGLWGVTNVAGRVPERLLSIAYPNLISIWTQLNAVLPRSKHRRELIVLGVWTRAREMERRNFSVWWFVLGLRYSHYSE